MRRIASSTEAAARRARGAEIRGQLARGLRQVLDRRAEQAHRAPGHDRPLITASRPISTAGADCVIRPTEMKSTPVSAIARMVSRRTPPEAIRAIAEDRKSTRLNSSHGYISYAVFCLKKKKP